MAMKIISVTDIKDFRIGNAENRQKGTGCTVIVCEEGAVGGVDVRGGGPATRETDLLRSENTVNSVNAVVLSGGSAFGLEAASGVMRELADRRIGFAMDEDIVVPIVCGASLFDLPIGDPTAFPDVHMGVQAVCNAYEGVFSKGNHGAGTGATVGKLKGYDRAMKSGIGTFACKDGVLEVGAIAAVNAMGDIYNGAGNIIAGLRSEDGNSIYGTIKTLKGMVHDQVKLIIDDSTSFISKSEIEAALAAAAKQYEEETAAVASDESATETIEESVNEEQLEEVLKEEGPEGNPDEVFTEEQTEEQFEEEQSEETFAEEQTEETFAEEQTEEIFAEEQAEEQLEEEKSEEKDEDDPSSEEVSEELSEEQPLDEEAAEICEEQSLGEVAVKIGEDQLSDGVSDEIQEASEEDEPVLLTREEMGYDIVFNTTISCLITNAALTKSQANKLASILHDAYARSIKPVHSTLDGDTVFVLATGKQEVNFDAFAALATDIMQYAIIDGAMSAEAAYGLPAARDMQKTGE